MVNWSLRSAFFGYDLEEAKTVEKQLKDKEKARKGELHKFSKEKRRE
jgi:hypothetical protein